MARQKGRNWCMTINNNAERFYHDLEAIYDSLNTDIRYICGQLERAAMGHLHFQGYIQIKNNVALCWLRNNISNTGHYEVQRGNNIQARDYCRKIDTREYAFIEFGTFCRGRGSRTDLISFKNEILKGKRQVDLLEKYTICMARFPRFYTLVRGLVRPQRTKNLTVRLNYGGTGLGKTRYAYDNFPKLYSIPLTSTVMWFDGYDLHETVLIDDFAGALSKVSLNYTLQLLDRYPIQVPRKGGFTWWMPTLIIITSNIHPHKWYKWDDRVEQYNALTRRITEVFYYEEGEDPIGLLEDEREEFNNGTRYM